MIVEFEWKLKYTITMGTKPDYRIYLHRMIEEQIKSRGVADKRVLKAFELIPRHMFVEECPLEIAYGDTPLSIGHGQTISQPYIVARMLELCDFTGQEKVLEIGTGSAFQTALLSCLAKEVFSMEIVDSLYHHAVSVLRIIGRPEFDNVTVIHGDGYNGLPEHAPFDRILLSAAPPKLPELLTKQLAEGGIMTAPVGVNSQSLLKIVKCGGELKKEYAGAVRFVPMVHGNMAEGASKSR